MSLGTAQLGLPYGVANRAGAPSFARAERVLLAAFDFGFSALDTAPCYGPAEEWIGAILREHRRAGRFRVTTKLDSLGAGLDPADVAPRVRHAVDGSRRRLGLDVLDELLVHDVEDWRRYGVALADALAGEVRRGTVARAGTSVYTPEEAEWTTSDARWNLVQHPANLLDHRLAVGGALARLGERGVAVQARSAYLQGLFALDVERLPPSVRHCRESLVRLRAILALHEIPPVEAALPIVLAQPFERVVVGADDPEQLEQSVRSAHRELPAALLPELRAAFADPDPRVVDPRRWSA